MIRAAYLQAFTFALLMIVVISMGLQQRHIRQLSREGTQAHTALCVFRDDLQRRVERSENFIKEHPEGVTGIPVATLQADVKNKKDTLASLDLLTCPMPKL